MKEIWKPFRHGYYEVSNMGRVYSVRSGKILKGGPDKDGYVHIISSLDGRQKTHKVHQLVARAFIGRCPSGKEVHHCDDNKQNNRWNNLKYKVKIEHTRHHTSDLDEHKVREIRRMFSTGKYHGHSKTLARKFRVSSTTIYFIVSNRRWREAA